MNSLLKASLAPQPFFERFQIIQKRERHKVFSNFNLQDSMLNTFYICFIFSAKLLQKRKFWPLDILPLVDQAHLHFHS